MQYNNPRLAKNNFDLLRLLFAGTVVLVHACKLSGYQELGIILGVLSSEVAIKSFFVISGFLIIMSYERSSSLASYASKRARRIYPAYFTVVMLFAVALILASSKTVGDYFSFVWLKYVLANLTFLNFFQHTLPGVFDANKLAAVNGALWTLKIEVMFYLAVPFFVFLFRRFGRLPILIICYCLSVVYVLLCTLMVERTGFGLYAELAHQLPGQLSYFMAGAFFYYYLQLFEKRIGCFIFLATFALVANAAYSLPLLEPFALATVVVFFGLFFYRGNFGKYGDFSYGIYILHFPIIQLFLQAGWFRESPWLFIISVIIVTSVSAIAMWHFVEKRFLLRSSHYVVTTASSGESAPNMTLNTDAPNRRAD